MIGDGNKSGKNATLEIAKKSYRKVVKNDLRVHWYTNILYTDIKLTSPIFTVLFSAPTYDYTYLKIIIIATSPMMIKSKNRACPSHLRGGIGAVPKSTRSRLSFQPKSPKIHAIATICYSAAVPPAEGATAETEEV